MSRAIETVVTCDNCEHKEFPPPAPPKVPGWVTDEDMTPQLPTTWRRVVVTGSVKVELELCGRCADRIPGYRARESRK